MGSKLNPGKFDRGRDSMFDFEKLEQRIGAWHKANATHELMDDTLAALREQTLLARSAEDDCQRAITRADSLALDLKCLQESTVDKKAHERLLEAAEDVHRFLQDATPKHRNGPCIRAIGVLNEVLGIYHHG